MDLKSVSNSPRSGPKSAKTANVDDRHINTPVFVGRGNHYVTPTLSNSPRNGPESAKTVNVDDRHVRAPWGSTTIEIALGPQNGE